MEFNTQIEKKWERNLQKNKKYKDKQTATFLVDTFNYIQLYN